METIKDANKTYDEFVKVVHDSHGKGNNATIYNLINNYGCTAEDVALIAKKTKNDDYLNDRLARNNSNERAVKRLISKTLYSNGNKVRRKAYKNYTFRDYGWYFKYIPEQYKDWPTLMETEYLGRLFDGGDNYWTNETLSMYCYNYVTTLLERDNYPSELLYNRFKDSYGYKQLVEPYNMKSLTVVYDLSFVWSTGYSHFMHSKLANYMDGYRYDYEDSNNNNTHYEIKRDKQKKLAEQVTQLDVLCNVMLNEIYTEDEIKNKHEYNAEKNEYSGAHALSYMTYLLDRYRKTGARKRGYPQSSRIELFSQAKTLEMLLGMGLGIKCKTNYGWDYKKSNKKLNKRIQTAYKTFIKSKTVDDRKAMRKLLKDQANIIINDFMGGTNSFECVELNCAEEQDKVFEQNASQPIVKTARSVSRSTSAPVTYVKKSFDLAALAKATTKTVEKARNA